MMKRIVFLGCILFFIACGSSHKLSNQNLAYLYAPGMNFIYPGYRICNINPDTSRVFFEISLSDLLFMKEDSTGSFKASFAIAYRVLPGFETKAITDTGLVYFVAEQNEDSSGSYNGYVDVKAPDSSDYIIELTLSDLNRNQAVASFLTIDRTGIQPANDFMVVDGESGKPYIPDYSDGPFSVRLLNSNSTATSIYMRYFENNFPLSKPPFSDNESKPLSYISDQAYKIDWPMRDPVLLEKPGIYHFQFDTLIKEGFTLFIFEEDFPKITSAYSLIESIRFLTNRQEYDKIQSSSNKKEAVDNFWLSMAGNRERARVLIKSYYSRVQYANNFFTSYTEGWKTDRGLIYIIFGPPGSIYRNDNSENWNYSQNYNYGPLNFTFDKLKNPFSGNDFQLRRNNYYEMPWYRAVESWRDGRVVNETD